MKLKLIYAFLIYSMWPVVGRGASFLLQAERGKKLNILKTGKMVYNWLKCKELLNYRVICINWMLLNWATHEPLIINLLKSNQRLALLRSFFNQEMITKCTDEYLIKDPPISYTLESNVLLLLFYSHTHTIIINVIF